MAIQLEDLVARLRLDTSGIGTGISGVSSQLESVGAKSTAVGKRMSLGITAPIVGIGIASVNLAATFDKTMRQVAIATDGPSKALEKLAIRMGAETAFSAGEAADAMLELAKGGMTAAQIQGGVLASTMKLATVGGTDLAAASSYASTAMNQFGLKAEDADSIVVALAGAANAGSASVDSLAQGLGNVGGVAKNMGLSIQETTGILSQLDSAGIKGAEGGTALRSMLNGLTPSSKKAKDAIADLGLSFTDARGGFRPMADIADQLQQKLGGLTEAQKAATLETIFGTYGQQAATQLMNGGREAVEKYTKAAYDQKTTQKLANAAMEGTSGALERAKGSIETAALMIGQVLAPYVEKAAGFIERLANTFTNLPSSMQGLIVAGAGILAIVGPLLIGFGFLLTAIGAIGLPVIGVVAALAALVAALVAAYQRSSEFRAFVSQAMTAVQNVIQTTIIPGALAIRDAFTRLAQVVVPIVMQIVGVVRQHMPEIKATVQSVFSSVQSIIKSVLGIVVSVITIATAVISKAWQILGPTILGVVNAVFPAIFGIIRGVFDVIKGIFATIGGILRGDWQGAWDGIKQVVSGMKTILVNVVKGIIDALVAVVKGAAGLMLSAGRAMIEGLIEGIKAMASAAASAALDVVKGALDSAKDFLKIGSPSKLFRDEVGKMIGAGLVEGIVGTKEDVREALSGVLKLLRKEGRDQLAGMVVDTQDKLLKWAGKYEHVTERLEKLRSKMKQLTEDAKALAARVLEAFENSGSLLSAQASVDAEGNTLPLTYADIAAHVANAAANAEEFAIVLQQLKDAGLSQGQIDELANAGPAAALATAQAILAAGPVAITELNALQARITAAGTETARLAAENMYAAAIASTQGLIDGLESQESKIEKIMRRIARKMIRALKDELKIKSPSRVFEGLGRLTGQGFVFGLDGMQRDVATAGQRLAQAAVFDPDRLAGLSTGVGTLGSSQSLRAALTASTAPVAVRVFIGDRELTDIVSVEVGSTLKPLTTLTRQGAF